VSRRRSGPVGLGTIHPRQGLILLGSRDRDHRRRSFYLHLAANLPRSDRVVLEANTDHWNRERGPPLERVPFRNDLERAGALDLVRDTEGEIDSVAQVSPADAGRVDSSEHAYLVTIDAMRIVSGLVNRDAALLDGVKVRKALNLAVDRDRLISEVFSRLRAPGRCDGLALVVGSLRTTWNPTA
jgi:ABC-type transport system substrate-binding protein